MRKVGGSFILVSLALFLVSALQSASTIRYVNNTDATCQGQSPCYSTIQAAIETATSGESVRIQSGEYDEAILIKKKNQSQ